MVKLKTATKEEQAEKDILYAKIFKNARKTEPNKNSGIVPEMDVVGKDLHNILCRAYLIGGDIFFMYETGRMEMVLGMEYRALGCRLQVLSKNFQLIDEGIREQAKQFIGGLKL